MSNISCVIPNYNGSDLMSRYLPSVERNLGGAGTEIIVVDDGSTDDSREMLGRTFPNVTVMPLEHQEGFAAVVNSGIRAAVGEFVVVLNNDVELTEGFLDSVLPLFDNPDVFAVSPKIIVPSLGTFDEGATNATWHRGLFYIGHMQGVTDVVPVLYATACAAVYRKSMLEELGGFDHAYLPFYWEDTDLGYRAWKRGWSSLYQPASLAYHQHSATISRLGQNTKLAMSTRNSFLFFWRNIEDRGLVNQHRKWIPVRLIRRGLAGDRLFVRAYMEALKRKRKAIRDRDIDSRHRRLSDREILQTAGVRV